MKSKLNCLVNSIFLMCLILSNNAFAGSTVNSADLNSCVFEEETLHEYSFTTESTISCLSGQSFDGHLQGVATDGTYIYWSFSSQLVKTDMNGDSVGVSVAEVNYHTGDIAYHDGKIYTAYAPNFVDSPVTSKIQVYDAADFSFVSEESYTFDYSFGGVAYNDGKLYIGAGTHETFAATVYVVDINTMNYLETKTFGDTYYYGIQCLGFLKDYYLLCGTYDSKKLVQVTKLFKGYLNYTSSDIVQSVAYGIAENGDGLLLGASVSGNKGNVNFVSIDRV